MKIAVVPNLKKEKAKACLEAVLSVLKAYRCQIVLRADFFGEKSFLALEKDEELVSCNFILTIGGDGTIIHVAKAAALLGKPVLGINAGKLGFTAGLEYAEIHRLPEVLEGKYRLEKRFMIEGELLGEEGTQTFLALNDMVLSGELSKIVDYRMAMGGKRWYHYRADGFILATPTGSTAYSLSAGGPVIEPCMECMVYTPICPHSLFDRSIIFSSGTELQVEIPENPGRLLLTVDGERPVFLPEGSRLNFSIAKRTASFLKLDDRGFYEVLNEKMIDRKD